MTAPVDPGPQFGFVHNDAHSVAAYPEDQRDPEKLVEQAERHLAAGMPRQAGELLTEARAHLLEGPRLDFAEALALVSGRYAADLAPDKRPEGLDALLAAHPTGGGVFGEGLRVVADLVERATTEGLGLDGPEDTAPRFRALPGPIRELVGRHLDRVLAGAVSDAGAQARAAQVEAEWPTDGRTQRAPLFFVPDPAYPRKRYVPDVDHRRTRVVLGLAAAVALVVCAVVVVVESGSTVALVGVPMVLLLLAAATSLIGRTQAGALWHREILLRLDRARPADDADYRLSKDKAARRFHAVLRLSAERAFDAAKPADKGAAARWARKTEGIRRTLHRELLDAYGHAYRTRPESLDWLVRAQVDRIAERWQAGFDRWSGQHRASGLERYLGAAAVVAACLVGLLVTANVVAVDSGTPLLWWLLTIVLGGAAATVVSETVAARTLHHWLSVESSTEFQQDLQRYQQELIRLQDRPTDDEMGTWLDHDLRHVRDLTLEIHGLHADEVIRQLTVVEGVPGAFRARVPRGPARYALARVSVFLLTENGIREFRTVLDASTGRPGGQGRLGFSYDVIVSAAVEEWDKQEGKLRRLIQLRETFAEDFALPPLTDPTIRLDLVLALTHGEAARIAVESYQDLMEEGEQRRDLFRVALETSGIGEAMRVLEAVAVDGRDWVVKEQGGLGPDPDPGPTPTS
jgi:hypothetical protein